MSDTIQKVTRLSYGQKFTLKTGVDLTGYTSLDFDFQKPGLTTTTTSALTADAEAGEIYWVSTSGFWGTGSDNGEWAIVAKATFASGVLYTRPVQVNVVDEYDS